MYLWTVTISIYLYTYLNGCQALLVQYVIKYCPRHRSIAGPRSTLYKLRKVGRNRSKGETLSSEEWNKGRNLLQGEIEQRVKLIKENK